MKRILILLVFLTHVSLSFAQPPKKDPALFKEMKEAFVQKELAITEEEGTLFWPIFQRFESEKIQLKKAAFGLPGERKKPADMNEDELNTFIQKQLDWKEKEAALQKKYIEEFKKILPASKVAKLIVIDEKFRQFLMKQVKEKSHGNHPGKP